MYDDIYSQLSLTDARLQDNARAGFAEPWQAELYACTHALCQRGLFSWTEWAAAFSAQIATHPQARDEGIEQAYFRQWLAAFETLLARNGICAAQDITALAARWRKAYLHTPHGQPVDLSNAERPCAATAQHTARGVPLAVSAARAS